MFRFNSRGATTPHGRRQGLSRQGGDGLSIKTGRTDLIDIWLHIAQDNPAAADRLLDRFEDVFIRLAETPPMGRPETISWSAFDISLLAAISSSSRTFRRSGDCTGRAWRA
jgi:hypothetical protein